MPKTRPNERKRNTKARRQDAQRLQRVNHRYVKGTVVDVSKHAKGKIETLVVMLAFAFSFGMIYLSVLNVLSKQ